MINASTSNALNQIPLVNSTQILTASAQAPMTSVVATTPVVTASTPVMTSTPITTSTTPVVAATTPIMTSSTPVVAATTPIMTSSTPVVATTTPIMTSSTPVVAATTPIMTSATPIIAGSTPIMGSVSGAPVTVTQPVVTSTVQVPQQGYGTSNFSTTVHSNPIVEDDYRLGRGILDDFRPTPYKTQIAALGATTGLATTGLANTALPASGLATTVSTPGVNVGTSNINDFL